MKVEKVLISLVVTQFPDLNVRVNLNILICYHVCYISAQVADFMSSVGNRLIGGKSTVAVENFIAIGRPTVLLVSWHYRFSSCYVFRVFGVSVRAQLKAESRKLTNSAIRILLLGSFHQRRRDIIATRPYENGEGTPKF